MSWRLRRCFGYFGGDGRQKGEGQRTPTAQSEFFSSAICTNTILNVIEPLPLNQTNDMDTDAYHELISQQCSTLCLTFSMSSYVSTTADQKESLKKEKFMSRREVKFLPLVRMQCADR